MSDPIVLSHDADTGITDYFHVLEDGKEWERNTDIAYVIQDGPLKNVGLKWRNATTRSNFGNDLDENRLILSYVLPLW